MVLSDEQLQKNVTSILETRKNLVDMQKYVSYCKLQRPASWHVSMAKEMLSKGTAILSRLPDVLKESNAQGIISTSMYGGLILAQQSLANAFDALNKKFNVALTQGSINDVIYVEGQLRRKLISVIDTFNVNILARTIY